MVKLSSSHYRTPEAEVHPLRVLHWPHFSFLPTFAVRFSICLSTFTSRTAMLPSCLQSLLAQTSTVTIVVDNAKTHDDGRDVSQRTPAKRTTSEPLNEMRKARRQLNHTQQQRRGGRPSIKRRASAPLLPATASSRWESEITSRTASLSLSNNEDDGHITVPGNCSSRIRSVDCAPVLKHRSSSSSASGMIKLRPPLSPTRSLLSSTSSSSLYQNATMPRR